MSESNYKALTIDSFREALESLQKHKPKREFVLHTGMAGMKMFNQAMDDEMIVQLRKTLLKRLRALTKNRVISKIKSLSLTEMINSPDRENMELAEQLIELKENGA